MIINYVQYNAITGEILSWGRGIPPQSGTYIETAQVEDLSNYVIDLQTLLPVPKTEYTPNLIKTQAQADGVDACEITGIPQDTLCIISMPDGTKATVTCTDGVLELTCIKTGIATIKFWHYAYVLSDQEVEFI